MMIKSRQLRSNGYSKYHARPQSYMALIHSNHWINKTCERPYIYLITHPFSLRCKTTHILSPLYFYPMNMHYGKYSVNANAFDFTVVAHYAEIILHLTNQAKYGMVYTQCDGITTSQSCNRLHVSTRRFIIHQATSLTQQLYKDKYAREEAK